MKKKQHYIEQRLNYDSTLQFIEKMYDRYPKLKSATIRNDDDVLYCDDEQLNQFFSEIYAVANYLEFGRNIIYIDRSVLSQLKTCKALEQNIIIDINKYFPFKGAYVDAPLDDKLLGFFVSPNPNNVDLGFSIAPFFTRSFQDEINKNKANVLDDDYSKRVYQHIINCCAFIASVNAGINLVYKPAKELKPNNKKKRSLCKWYEAGFRIGSEIREYEKRKSPNRRTGIKVRPHIRRAHWHHFWTGSKDNRKLVLKWVAQTSVGAKNGDIATTLRLIRGDV